MSTSHKESIFALQDVELLVRRGHIPTSRSYDDISCKSIQELYVVWAGVAWDTVPSSIGIIQKKGVIIQWLHFLLGTPFEDVLSACKDLASSLVSKVWDSYDSFKRSHKQNYPFTGELMSPCKWIIEGAVRWNDPQSYRRVRTFLLFPTRINVRSEDLKDSAVSHFIETQDLVRSWSEKNEKAGVHLREIISRWFRNAECRLDERCHHGPGRTAEVERKQACITSKYAQLYSDSLLAFVGLKSFEDEFVLRGDLTRTSKLICVPKDFSKYRTICAEPTILQYCQQGVAKYLIDGIRESSLSNHVTLEDQGPNRYLALIGSLDCSFATVDLSDASDTIAWTLVRSAFMGTPFLRYFYACRSREVRLPNKKSLPLSSFATMGSALTFPVESIIYAATVERAFDLCGVPRPSRKYRVYGDDIVCPEAIFDCLMTQLTDFGFFVNSKKTFHSNSHFRESCGGEYIFGYDVTPLRIGRRFSAISSQNKPEQFLERISLINQLFWADYPTARSCLLSHMEREIGKPLFSDNPDRLDCVYSPAATNYHLDMRVNHRYQVPEYLAMGVTPGKVHGRREDCDAYRLYEWLRVNECEDDVPDVQCDIQSIIDGAQGLVYDISAPPTLRRVWRRLT